LINGYSNVGDMDTAQYLDEPQYGIFGPAWKHLVCQFICIPAARIPVSDAYTRDILYWWTSHWISVLKRPLIRFV
jgi:hypothetical protein